MSGPSARSILRFAFIVLLPTCGCARSDEGSVAANGQFFAAKLGSPAKAVLSQQGRVTVTGRRKLESSVPPKLALRTVNSVEIICERRRGERSSTCREVLAEASTELDEFDRKMGTTGFLSVRSADYEVLEWSDVAITARSGSLDLRIFLDGRAADRSLRFDTGPPENRTDLVRWHLANSFDK